MRVSSASFPSMPRARARPRRRRREARRATRATRAMASSTPTSTRGLARARAVVARGARRGTNRSFGGGDARRRRATRAMGGGAEKHGEGRDDNDAVASRRAMRRARRERAESTREGEATEEEAAEAAASAERWMKILKEEAARDPEIASLLESANGDPRAVEAKIRERFETKREKIYQERSGSTVPTLVTFREVNPFSCWIWI